MMHGAHLPAKKQGLVMMKEETSNDDSLSDPQRSGFNEEYESLADHELAMINPFASSRRRPPVLETDSSSSNPSTSPTASQQRPSSFSPFDPLGSSEAATRTRALNSLMDDLGSDRGSPEAVPVKMTQSAVASGMAGFLEMEGEPPRSREDEMEAERVLEQQDDLIDFTPADSPIQTTSGLLLTHRRTATEKRAERMSSAPSQQYRGPYPPSYRPHPNRFEVESGPWGSQRSDGFGRAPGALGQARRMLSWAKLWVLFFCAVLLAGTGVIFHTFLYRESRRAAKNKTTSNQQQEQNMDLTIADQVPQVIVLRPLQNASELARQQREVEAAQRERKGRHGSRRLLSDLADLRTEFDNWILKHGKVYHTDHEKEHRFGIWKDNHFQTMEKNRRHGNCPMMKQPVFGSNHLQDLTTEEFQSQFLTGYNGPNADGHEVKTGRKRMLTQTPPVMHPGLEVTRHPTIHERLLKEWAMAGFTSSSSCKWYDVACWIRLVFQQYLYVGTGRLEPKYDENTYPNSIDWRDYGAVSDVRKQGDCGACWAITAVETVESAYFIGTGSMLDLSESEVISCTDTCNMCFGGWPQDAYDYVMEHKGIMLRNNWGYDGSTLLALSQSMEAGDSELDSDLFGSYISANCPASQKSGDEQDGGSRYGNIKGYGFATERCVCYSDGSGCDCDNQNEGMAVRNLASYGPATVCLDASTWQDYNGGIITSSSGCSAKFLAMNHCVQVVGYAYNDGRGEGGDESSRDSGSGSHDSGSGSQDDDSNRVGYWIVRNQWSSNWGMNGYAYVSMGENTCGILNDVTQAYM